jgi:hypothetical protein
MAFLAEQQHESKWETWVHHLKHNNDNKNQTSNENDDSKKTAAAAVRTHTFYAIRKCQGLKGPAIFMNYEDCSNYLTLKNDDDDVDAAAATEYQEFNIILNAMEYIYEFIKLPANNTNAATSTDVAASTKAKKSLPTRRKRSAAGVAKVNEQGGEESASIKTTPNAKKLKRDVSWGFQTKDDYDDMFPQLVKFKEEHGHLSVPHNNEGTKETPLRLFVVRLRLAYNKLKEGKPSILNGQRIAQITELGFNFTPKGRLSWQCRAKEWKDFVDKNGCDPTAATDESLTYWVYKQRDKYQLFQAGEKTNLSKAQVTMLTEWNFIWSSGYKKPDRTGTHRHTWDERFQQLVDYKDKYGTTKGKVF